jgi:H+/Cl- antiporter ClcA
LKEAACLNDSHHSFNITRLQSFMTTTANGVPTGTIVPTVSLGKMLGSSVSAYGLHFLILGWDYK